MQVGIYTEYGVYLNGHSFSSICVLSSRIEILVLCLWLWLNSDHLFCSKIYYIKGSRKHNPIIFDFQTEYS